MKRKIIRIILIVLFSGIFVFSAFKVAEILNTYKKSDDFYENIASEYVKEEPDKESKFPITVDLKSLCEQNSDIVGWIYMPESSVNYPVVQSKDNEYYLRKDINGAYLYTGSIFVDFRNTSLGSDANYVFYGHNIKNGTMFGDFLNFRYQWYYDSHPCIYYKTLSGSYKIDIIAGYLTNGNDPLYSVGLSPDGDISGIIPDIIAKSDFKANMEINEEDIGHICSFLTCAYEEENSRYALVGIPTQIE